MTRTFVTAILCTSLAGCAAVEQQGPLENEYANDSASELCGDGIDNDGDTVADEGCEHALLDLGTVLSCGIEPNFEGATDPFYERDRISCTLSPDVAALPELIDLSQLRIKAVFANAEELDMEFVDLHSRADSAEPVFVATFVPREERYPLTLTTQMSVDILEQTIGIDGNVQYRDTPAFTFSQSTEMDRDTTADSPISHALPFQLWSLELAPSDELADGFPDVYERLTVKFDYAFATDAADTPWSTLTNTTEVTPRATLRVTANRTDDLRSLAQHRFFVPVPTSAQSVPALSVEVIGDSGTTRQSTELSAGPGAYVINSAAALALR